MIPCWIPCFQYDFVPVAMFSICADSVSAAALQGLKKLYVAYTRYITNGTNSAITHLTGNKTRDVVTLIFIILRVSRILKIKANFSEVHLSMELLHPAFICCP